MDKGHTTWDKGHTNWDKGHTFLDKGHTINRRIRLPEIVWKLARVVLDRPP